MNKLTKEQKENIYKMIVEHEIKITKKHAVDFIKRNERFLSKLDMFKIKTKKKK